MLIFSCVYFRCNFLLILMFFLIFLGQAHLVNGPLMTKTLVWKPRLPGQLRPHSVLPQYLEKSPFLSTTIWENNQTFRKKTLVSENTRSDMFKHFQTWEWYRNRNNNTKRCSYYYWSSLNTEIIWKQKQKISKI